MSKIEEIKKDLINLQTDIITEKYCNDNMTNKLNNAIQKLEHLQQKPIKTMQAKALALWLKEKGHARPLVRQL